MRLLLLAAALTASAGVAFADQPSSKAARPTGRVVVCDPAADNWLRRCAVGAGLSRRRHEGAPDVGQS